MRDFIRENKGLFFIFFLSAFLRFVWAIYYPITLDEAWSYYVSRFPFKSLIEIVKQDSTSPLLIYIIHKIFDISKTEIGVRWFFVLINILSFIFMYLISDKSKISALIIATSFFLITYGDISRMHSITLFLSSICIYSFSMFMEKKSNKYLFLFIISSIFMFYNFYPSITLIFSILLSGMFYYREDKSVFRKFLFSIIIITISGIWSFYFLTQNRIEKDFLRLNLSSGAIAGYIFYAFVYSEEILRFNAIRGIKIIYFIILFLPVFVLFIYYFYRNRGLKEKIFLVVFVSSLLIIFLISIFIPQLLYSPKYLIFLYPVFIYSFSKSLDFLKPLVKRVFILSIILINLFSYYHSLAYKTEDWRKVAEFVEKNKKNYDKIFIFNEHMKYPFSFYYNGDFTPLSSNPFFSESILQGVDRFLYIKSHDYKFQSVFYERMFLSGGFKMTDFFDFVDIKLYVYDKK